MQRTILTQRKRDNSIDIMKGIMVFLMILCHVLMFFPEVLDTGEMLIDTPFTIFVGLTSFSGFMFCLGFVFPIAYSNKEDAEKRMFIGFIKTLLAFYVSGTVSLLLLQNAKFVNIIDLILIRNIPGFSEFIISFAFVFLVNIFLFKPIKKLCRSKIKFSIIAVLCLLFTGFNYSTVTSDFFGVFLGSNRFNCFPIVQYGFYFLLGFYLSENNIVFDIKLFFISLFSSLLLLLHVAKFGYLPSRFPPSLSWVLGSFFTVYCYFLLCKVIRKFTILELAGKHSLAFLLISNIILFILNKLIGEPPFNRIIFNIILFALIMGVCYLYIYLRKLVIKVFNQ